jgi:hypothetical protein
MVAIDPSSRAERLPNGLMSRFFLATVITGAVVGGMVLGEYISFDRNDNFQVSVFPCRATAKWLDVSVLLGNGDNRGRRRRYGSWRNDFFEQNR